MASRDNGISGNTGADNKVNSEDSEKSASHSEKVVSDHEKQKNETVASKDVIDDGNPKKPDIGMFPHGQPGLGTSIFGTWDPSILTSPTASVAGSDTGDGPPVDGKTGKQISASKDNDE